MIMKKYHNPIIEIQTVEFCDVMLFSGGAEFDASDLL